MSFQLKGLAKKYLLYTLIILSVSQACLAQSEISGPSCVLTTLVYQYDIKGNWKENDKINICVDGGVLTETGTTCIEKQSVSFVKVQWSGGKNTGKITATSIAGTAAISVSIAPSFNPGFIETTEKQIIAYNKLPSSLSCTQASGGNCAPSFFYQWEQSSDRIKWTPVSGANGRNLSFSTPFKQTSFFRRRVFESSSQTVAYSNTVAVFVIPKKN